MATPPTLALSLLSLLSLLATTGAQTSVKLGDVVHNLLFPSNELLGNNRQLTDSSLSAKLNLNISPD